MLKPGDLIVPEQANLGTVGLDCDYDKCYEMNELVPDKVIPSNKMEEFYLKRNHRIMNKWWHYFEIYDTFYTNMRTAMSGSLRSASSGEAPCRCGEIISEKRQPL